MANKSEFGRMVMAQQRMQQNVSGAGTPGSISLASGGARVAGLGASLTSDNQLHQDTQSAGVGGSHDGSSSQVQESGRSATAESSVPSVNDQSLPQGSSNNDGGQNALRRNSALGLAASAASAFDAAKDVMETLRSKHTNLASELEVTVIFSLHMMSLSFHF